MSAAGQIKLEKPARKLPEFRSQYLNDYLRMVEDSESPRLYHVWCALSGISIALGRRCWVPNGTCDVLPNQFVLLVGNPAVRKSTAMNTIKKLLRKATFTRFAPADTAGQRQGLAKVMYHEPENKEALNGIEVAANDKSLMSLTDDEILSLDNSDSEAANIADLDKHHIAVMATEFSRFIGQNNVSMLDFLVPMWDGDDYDYETKNGSVVMKNPLINLIGCTTPTSISNSLPAVAEGQGFMSRMILVYGGKKYKEVPRMSLPPAELVASIQDTLSYVYYNMHGAFGETPEAYRYYVSKYGYKIDTTDSRFAYYNERRATHLIKLAMAFAASRKSMEITEDDYHDAHNLLVVTEKGMPEALGQFGLSPLAQVKQGVLEFLRHIEDPIDMQFIQAAFHRDARAQDITEVLQDLQRAGLIEMTKGQMVGQTPRTMVIAKRQVREVDDKIMDMLAEI